MTFCIWKSEDFRRSWGKQFEDEDWKAMAWQNICLEESGTLKRWRRRFRRRSCRWIRRGSLRIRWRDPGRNGFRGNGRERIGQQRRWRGRSGGLGFEIALGEWVCRRWKKTVEWVGGCSHCNPWNCGVKGIELNREWFSVGCCGGACGGGRNEGGKINECY